MEIPYTRTNRPDTGLYNAKVGIWLFLASEVMLFGGLFSSYIFLRVGADFHWPVHELAVWPGFVNTLVLILSSVTVVMAWASLKMRKIAQYKLCMWITIICAARPSGFGLDDAYCAGVLVERLMRLGEVELSDAAEAARMLALAEPDPRRLLGRSAAGRYVTRIGLAADVDYAAGVDTSTAVPRLGHHFSLVLQPVEE